LSESWWGKQTKLEGGELKKSKNTDEQLARLRLSAKSINHSAAFFSHNKSINNMFEQAGRLSFSCGPSTQIVFLQQNNWSEETSLEMSIAKCGQRETSQHIFFKCFLALLLLDLS
jgi:hypothetical protein